MRRRRWALRIGAGAGALIVGMFAAVAGLAAPSGWLALDGGIRFNPASGATYDWANSGSGAPTYVCAAGAVNLSGPGGLFNCGRPSGGTGPPIAPTVTPAAATDPSIISAVFVVDAISSDTTSCGGGDSTTIAGGAKNGDAFTAIGTTSGAVPAKDDLSNVYAVSHTRADTGHPEVFFAAERLVNNGDSHMDFEFLQSVVGVTAACSGVFTGSRSEGDLLVAVDFTAGGALAGTSVYQWHCLAEPGPQPADGTVCNPAGAAPPEHYHVIAAPSFLSFLVNSAAISCGGWVCRDAISGDPTIVSTNDFLEGGVDLAGIPFTGCFNTFLPHTRTAQSFTSGLKDFAGPVAFRSCRDPATASTSAPGGTGAAPGVSATDSVTIGNGGAGPVPTGTVTFFLCAPAQTTAGGCTSGGAQVGSAKPLLAGTATSDPTTATTSPAEHRHAGISAAGGVNAALGGRTGRSAGRGLAADSGRVHAIDRWAPCRLESIGVGAAPDARGAERWGIDAAGSWGVSLSVDHVASPRYREAETSRAPGLAPGDRKHRGRRANRARRSGRAVCDGRSKPSRQCRLVQSRSGAW